MQGDDIRDQRQMAEKQVNSLADRDHSNYQLAHASLALWVIAEQLYEVRENLSILIDRKERNT